MLSARVGILLVLLGCWLRICRAQPCPPAFPTYSPALLSAQSAGIQGLQVIVPTYNFTCSGMINSVTFYADVNYGVAGFVIQTWRPQLNGTYSLQQSMDIPQSAHRDNVAVFFNTSIPVLNGDTIGYQLKTVANMSQQVHLYLDATNMSSEVVVYQRMGQVALCEASLCDSGVLEEMKGFAPFISVEFVEQSVSSVRGTLQCSYTTELTPCSASDPPVPSPSPSLLPDDPGSTGEPTTDDDEDSTGSDDALLNLNLTTETVTVLAVGLLLFVVLIVLVVVLVACVCRKRKPPQYRFKNPTPGSNVGTPVTVSVVSSSSGAQLVSSSSASSDRYINSAMQTPLANGTHNNGASVESSIDPLPPADRREKEHGHRGRRMKSPLLPDSPWDPLPPIPTKAHSEAHSYSRQISKSSRDTPLPPSPSKSSIPPASASPHSASVPPTLPATVPPPAAIALLLSRASPQTASPTSSTVSIPEHSVPLPPHPLTSSSIPAPTSIHLSVASVTTVSSERPADSGVTHNIIFVNSSSKPAGKQHGHSYDHLAAKGRLTKEEVILKPMHERSRQPKTRKSHYIYTYVPTAEQRRLVKMQNMGRYEVTDEVEEVKGYDRLKFFMESETFWSPATTTSGLYAQLYENKYRELPREQIIIEGQIGAGQFGSVSKGVWQLRGEGGEVMEGEVVQVAVKVVKKEAEEVQRVKLLQEAAIMGQFAHPNVVRLHGVVTVGDPTMIVLEYMPQGDLKSYLQKMRPQVTKKPVPKDAPSLFIKFGKDIVSGMRYLARKNFIHRDLATRNILLNRNLTCKIGDFGMARDIAGSGDGSDYYKSHGGIIPVKWTAPESLNYNKYTSASDVWSYGMVLYEIWALGYKPFHNLANPIVIALVTSRHCQAPPPGCPRPIYHLMVECWNPQATQRPTFDCIQTYLDSSEDSLLQWAPADTLPGKQAHLLGAPLVEGNNLYLDLQRIYQNQLLAQMQAKT